MASDEFLFHSKISINEGIRPWLILGPFYKSFSDQINTISFFESPRSSAGRDIVNTVIEEAKEILLSSPWEGEEVNFLDMKGRWNLVRRPEKYFSWGRYNFSNHLGAAFLTTIIIPDYSGEMQFELLTNSRALVAINGKIVFDTDTKIPKERDKLHLYNFYAELQSKENRLTIGLFRLGRGSTVGFLLKSLNRNLEVYVPISKYITKETRIKVENEVNSLRLERDVFYPEHSISLLLNKISKAQLEIKMSTLDGKVIKEVHTTENNKIDICSGGEIPDGEYQIDCLWRDKNGYPITSINLNVAKITPTQPLLGYENLDKRKHIVLEHFSENPKFVYGELWNPISGYILGRYERIWGEVAKYALGQYEKIDEQIIIDVCRYISKRQDCSEFLMQALLRLMYWENTTPNLKSEIREMIKRTILGFRYWVDEPGTALMHMSSENHRLLLHTSEFLAGQLFPTEEFTNSHQLGLYHAVKGRMYLTEWLRQRGKFGFDEWNSNCYYTVNIAALTNILDFTPEEDYKLRQMTKQILDYMFYILAEDTFHGIFGTTCGRTYASYIKYPDFQYTSAICWLLYGEGSLWGDSGMGVVSLATSSYKLPEILSKIATDYSNTIESYQRQGFSMNKEPSANFVVYRTSDYMISSLQDHLKGESAPQTHVAQITLKNKVVIFWSCPSTSGEGPGLRPDYWSGNTSLPRAIQYRNVLALVWKQNEFSWMTHCFFEVSKFDEVRFKGKWAFGKVEDGYIGIFSQNGMYLEQQGKYARRELICPAASNIWLIECGSKTDWGSFEKFIETLSSTQIIERDDSIVYLSPSIGKFTVGWDIEPTVEDTPIKLRDYPLIISNYAYSEFGSGSIKINYKNEKLELRFD